MQVMFNDEVDPAVQVETARKVLIEGYDNFEGDTSLEAMIMYLGGVLDSAEKALGITRWEED